MKKSDVNVANEIIFDLQDRIDEAIKYIEKYKDIQAKYGYVDFDNEDLDNLLKILKWSDKE